MIRKSLDLRSWEAAQKLVRDWEANPEGGGVTVKEACEKFKSDAKARNLSEGTMRKVKLITSEMERNYAAVAIRSVTVDDVRQIREGWKLAPITMQKRLEMLRSFFKFCVDSGWIDRNPAKAISCQSSTRYLRCPLPTLKWKRFSGRLKSVNYFRADFFKKVECVAKKLNECF